MPRLYQTYVRCQVNLHAEEFAGPTPTATRRTHHTLFTARSQVLQANHVKNLVRRIPGWLAAGLLLAGAVSIAAAPSALAEPIPGTTCALFPTNSIFNTDISALPVNAQSTTWMGNMTQHANLHPDLGTPAQLYGMPINVAPAPTTGVTPTFGYDPESDHPAEGYPVDQSTMIEGGPGAPSGSDRHALTLNKNLCKLYEIYNLQNFTSGRAPTAGPGAVWDLSSNAMRPDGWTSADAAGLPMLPLLLRPDEILAGSITHAIRFTTHCTHGYIWPGSHNAGSCDATFPPMGARFRLRAGYDISGFSANTQVVLKAFQHYGLLLADNGSDWYFGGSTDSWWGTIAGDAVVTELETIPAAQFDAVDETSLQVAANSYAAAPPVPGVYTAVTPVRLLDTRTNGTTLGGGGSLNLTVGGVPGNATAVVLNITATNISTAGFFTVFPTGFGRPTASNLNWSAHETVPNLVTAGLGGAGRVTMYNGVGSADAVVDLEGYYATSAGGSAGEFVPVTPARITDTRSGSGQANAGMQLGPTGTLDVQSTGAAGIPATGGAAVWANVTAVGPTAASDLVVWPDGTSAPVASDLNFVAGQAVPNLVIVKLSAGGKIDVRNDFGSTSVIVDLVGWYG